MPKERKHTMALTADSRMWLRIARYCEVQAISRTEAIRRLIDVGLDDWERINRR